jgi:hypothetical protein
VPGARLIEIDGMGHDLEGPLPETVAGHAIDFITTRAEPAKTPKE